MKYCFFFPSRTVGGVQKLFIRLANILSVEHTVYIIDYPDGFISRNVSSKVLIIQYNDREVLSLDEDFILITQANYLLNLNEFLHLNGSVKLCFWYLHPNNLSVRIPFFRKTQLSNVNFLNFINNHINSREFEKTKRLIEKVIHCSSMGFMDRANYTRFSDIFNIKVNNVSYTPLYIETEKSECDWSQKNKLSSVDDISLTWLGRIENDFKLQSILK